jgi:hypothetical protein
MPRRCVAGYIGKVTYQGVEHDGSHQPLIDDGTLYAVQQLLASRTSAWRPRTRALRPRARQPDDYVEKEWAAEPWHSGYLPRPATDTIRT